MSHKGARSGAPIDWSDPEQAAAQARIDVLRKMMSCNPMSYSEKEEVVRQRMADEAKRAEQTTRVNRDSVKKNWDI